MKAFWLTGLALLAATPTTAQEAPLAPGAHRADMGGLEVWYRVAGKQDGVPLVFLHGGPGEGSMAFQAIGGPELERTRRLVYLDQRGAGRSDRPKDASFYSIAILVEDVERLRRHLGVEKIALLGHSFGTILALEYAAKYPERTDAVVLAAAVNDVPHAFDIGCGRLQKSDPQAYARAAAGKRPGAYPRCDILRAYPGPAGKDYVYRNMFPDPATGKLVDRLDEADGLRNTGEMGGAIFAQGFLNYRFGGTARVTAPVVIIAGGKDYQASIEPQRALAAELPRGRLIEYPDNGHFMFIEDPARFARDVSAFLNGDR